MVFAGNSFEAVGCQCTGEHAAEGVPAVFDGVFSQVVGKVTYAAQGVIVAVQEAATGSEVAVAPRVFSVMRQREERNRSAMAYLQFKSNQTVV